MLCKAMRHIIHETFWGSLEIAQQLRIQYVSEKAAQKYSSTLQFYSLSCEVIRYTLQESELDILGSKLPDRVLTVLAATGFKKFKTNTLSYIFHVPLSSCWISSYDAQPQNSSFSKNYFCFFRVCPKSIFLLLLCRSAQPAPSPLAEFQWVL